MYGEVFLGRAASGYEGIFDVSGIMSPSSGCTVPAHPEIGDVISYWNVGRASHRDTAFCPRKFHWIMLLWKLQDL